MKRGAGMALALCLLLCGCKDYRELDQRDIVSGVAVDRVKDGYALLLSIADVTAGSDDNPGARWLPLQGASLAEAIGSGAGSTGRQAYLGHMQLAVAGDEMARGGLDDLLWYLQRNADVHMTLALAVAEGDAVALFQKQEDAQAAAFDLSRAAVHAGKAGLAPDMPLYRFLSDRQEDGIEGILPRISTAEGGAHIEGAALFRGDKLCGRLDPKLTQVLLMARGLLHEGVLTVNQGEGSVAFDIRGCTAQLSTQESGDGVFAKYEIKLSLELCQGAQSDSLSAEIKEQYEKLAQSEVERRFVELCTLLQKTYGVDSLGVGRHIHRHDAGLWARMGEDWEKNFAASQITAEVDVVLHGSGRSLK